jgi:plastocyanin
MRLPIRTLVAASTLILGSLAGPMPAAAGGSTTYTIGVDAGSPAGHDFEYVDYFPRSGVRVHQGAVIDFNWNLGLDGLHTVTFLATGAAAPPFIVPEFDEGFQLQFNPIALHPSSVSCGSSAGNPCSYDGSALVSSGAIANAAPSSFFVRLDVSPGTYTYICLIHPQMQGSIRVVPDSARTSTVKQVQKAAAAQLAADTRQAFEKEEDTNESSVKKNPDGTRTITVIAGTATRYVEITEMLPKNVKVRVGDTVKWVTTTLQDPHTVTFPLGPGSASVDPLNFVCEGAAGDTAPPGGPPPSFGCANPLDSEAHVIPQPQGPTVISSRSTVASSGIISTLAPGPDNYSFSFSAAGSFPYMCRIHDNMVGTVQVVNRR